MPTRSRTSLIPLALAMLALGLATVACTEQGKALLPPSEQAEETRRLVITFYNEFFNQHDLTAAERYLAEDYRQHNPFLPDGRQAVVDFFREEFAKNPQRSSVIVRSAVDDDLVYLHVHAKSDPADRGRAVVDIFRVKDGRIVEHWDVAQPIPETAANQNTMF